MEFILLSDKKLKICLSREDVEDLSLNLYEISSTEEIKDIFTLLLDKAKRKTGFSPHYSKLGIELLPARDGGYVIYCRVLSPRGGGYNKSNIEPVIFAFDNFEALLESIIKVSELYSHRIHKSSVYKLGNGYRLIVYPLDYTDKRSEYFLSEFGELVGKGSFYAAHVEEHGKPIVIENAMEKLIEIFGEN